MSSPEIPQPHDSLIRYTLGSTANAVSLFQAHLPPALVAAFSWEPLRMESGSFVDEELRRLESDLLYSVPVRGTGGSEVLLYLLLEQQSTSGRWLPLRLLGYMLAIWQRRRQQHPAAEGLPLLLPLLLAQVEGGWRVSAQFADLLNWPESLRAELERHQPRFEHLLIDLAKIAKDDLQGNPSVRLAQRPVKGGHGAGSAGVDRLGGAVAAHGHVPEIPRHALLVRGECRIQPGLAAVSGEDRIC